MDQNVAVPLEVDSLAGGFGRYQKPHLAFIESVRCLLP
jgi:hypothetical protein